MDNNDILRRLRYVFDLADTEMAHMFSLGGAEIELQEVTGWLKKEDHPAFKACDDEQMATFLNGFIVARRGRKDGAQPAPEIRINNNIVLPDYPLLSARIGLYISLIWTSRDRQAFAMC